MRNSLKPKRDSHLFELFQQELEKLAEMASNQEIELGYFDEIGFNLKPNVPYAWQEIGKTALLPATRGKNHTLLGILNPLKQNLQAMLIEGAANAECIVKFLDEFASGLRKKTVLILDNASIHKATIVQNKIQDWKEKNLFLQFIPAYSPELNRIEILWKQMKSFWIKATDYASKDKLKKRIEDIVKQYNKKYQISFV